MKRKTLIALTISALPLASLGLLAGAARFSQRTVEAGLVDGQLRPCPPTPNCACSELGDLSPIEPFLFTGDATLAFRSLVDFLESESDASLVDQQEDYVHAVYLTPFFGFADDVEFRLDREAQRIHVRSASRVGRSDLGANRERIERIRRDWASPGGG